MKPKFAFQSRRRVAASLAISCFLPAIAYAQTTGFLQTDAGPYDYNTPGNWVGGAINGIWDSSLVVAANTNVTFSTDTNLGTGLSFLYDYSGSAFNVTLKSDGVADHSTTLGGDILVNTTSANRTTYIGSSSTNQKLNVDLGGGTRTFDVRGTIGNNLQRNLTFYNDISNGSLILQGGGNINLSAGTSTSTTSVSQLTLKNTHLNANAYSDISTSGALAIDGVGGANASGNTGGIAILSMASTGSRNHTLSADSLSRQNNGVALFRGTSLGADVVGTNNISNITFTSAPTLVGGGGLAGTTNISILPWALGGTSTSGFETFVTYDANGIRPLDPTTEFVTYAGAYSGTITGTDVNVKVADGGTVEFTGSNTVNSLSVNYNSGAGTATTINGGTITVTSGAVSLISRQGANLNNDLDFGSAQGVIGYIAGKGTTMKGVIAGSGGLVFYQSQPSASSGSGGSGIVISDNAATSTYTGDTYILSRATINVAGFLPNDTRTGNVHVNGLLEIGTSVTMNGLNGTGILYKTNSGSATLTIGDNDADGSFSGAITQNGTTGLVKIGAGTQTLAGDNTYTGNTTVNDGALVIGSTGSLKFRPTSNNTNNKVTGSAAATFNGAFNIDLSSTNVTDGNIWTLVDVTSPTYDASTFHVISSLGDFSETSPGVHELVDGSNTWTFTESDGLLALAITTGNYATWAGDNVDNQTADEDYNGDGVSNGIAYFMDDTGIITLPGIVGGAVTWTNGGNIPASTYGTEYVVETSPDLVTWDPVDEVDLDANDDGPAGSLTYTLPPGMGTLFARLKVTPQ